MTRTPATPVVVQHPELGPVEVDAYLYTPEGGAPPYVVVDVDAHAPDGTGKNLRIYCNDWRVLPSEEDQAETEPADEEPDDGGPSLPATVWDLFGALISEVDSEPVAQTLAQLQDIYRRAPEVPNPFSAGDWADHKSGELDPREVSTVQGELIYLRIGTIEAGPFLAENYERMQPR